MTIGVFVNENSVLSKNTCEKFKTIVGKSAKIVNVAENLTEKCDYIVVFGGDGTTVKSVPYALGQNVPVLVVNTGTFGFLSDFTPENLQEVIRELLSRPEYTEKTLISVSHNGKSKICLNDVVIQRKPKNELVSEVI
ncbi:MAG TPA: hypothetical protein DDY82_02580, partial [Clostridiales bacterium]|nr:hypothetical protein [Clostridiales bacterium]